APASPGTSSGSAEIAANFAGEMDELLLANQPRAAPWISFAAKSQEAGSQMITVATAETTEGGGDSYLVILLSAVTLDGWVVIGILMVMLVISFAIMIGKALLLARTEKANLHFVGAFRKMTGDLTALYRALSENPQHTANASFAGSNLYRIYRVGMDELLGRLNLYKERGQQVSLSPQAIGAIKATLDAGLVKEIHRLNSQMVLLTIAISGGPFLGLLGTVVGVMITFAAIAAAGDVNVNSIAPGIAAALVATVAGLAVAIPALFGYNYLSSRIKSLNADMQVFADELITKLAEGYSN
ncbi:MAG: MotA/TolQ/ExbB proton channel family protein, partial [Burkholderiales bacterium]